MAQVVASCVAAHPKVEAAFEGLAADDGEDGFDGTVWIHELFAPLDRSVRLRPGVQLEGRDEMDTEYVRAALAVNLPERIMHAIEARRIKERIILEEQQTSTGERPIMNELEGDEWMPRADFLAKVVAAYRTCTDTSTRVTNGELIPGDDGLLLTPSGAIWIPRDIN